LNNAQYVIIIKTNKNMYAHNLYKLGGFVVGDIHVDTDDTGNEIYDNSR